MRDDPSYPPGSRSVSARGDINGAVVVTGDGNYVVVYQGCQITIPGPDAIQRHRLALRQKLEDDAAKRWGGMAAYIQEEGVHLPIQASPYQPGLVDQREDLVAQMAAATRTLVLGEPGSGKTVALQRLAWELCACDELLIPVIVDLLYYAGTPLELGALGTPEDWRASPRRRRCPGCLSQRGAGDLLYAVRRAERGASGTPTTFRRRTGALDGGIPRTPHHPDWPHPG